MQVKLVFNGPHWHKVKGQHKTADRLFKIGWSGFSVLAHNDFHISYWQLIYSKYDGHFVLLQGFKNNIQSIS